MTLLSSHARSDDAILGSNNDSIRQMLFASQSLAEQVQRMNLDKSESPFSKISHAYNLKKQGKTDEAVSLLRNLLEEPNLETRVRLSIWSGLRELGEYPNPSNAHEVLGAIIEMPSGNGFDTLAAYADGSVRYLNFSGRAIFWDQDDQVIKRLCQALIDSTNPDSDRAKPRVTLDLPKKHPQVTLLTRSGPFVITSPNKAVSTSGTALMIELMRRVEKTETEQTTR